jgi:hypothetical protein
MNITHLPLAVAIMAFSTLATSHAGVVYSEDFTGLTTLPSAFTVGSNTGVTLGVSTVEGNPAPSLVINDTSTANSGSATVYGNNWSSFSTASGVNNIFQVSFDWRIDSSLSSGASTLRFNISLGGTTATSVNIGFGHASISGTDTNFFYAAGGTSGATPSASNAIGYNGTSFLSGFNLGTYSSTTATNNNTGGDYFRFTLNYTDQASTALLSVFNTSDPSQSATFTVTGITPTSVSNTSGRYIQALSGQSGTGTAYVDNLVVATVPEPSTLALTMACAAGFFFVSRRRS